MSGPHWRKAWPEGATDNGDGDDDIIEAYNTPLPHKHKTERPKYVPVKFEKYPLSEDVLTTQNSIKQAEKITSKKLTAKGAAKRGFDMMEMDFEDNKHK